MNFPENFHELVQHVIVTDTIDVSLPAFRPEMALCATIVALLLVRMIVPRWTSAPTVLSLLGSSLALWLLAPWQYFCNQPLAASQQSVETFTGMLQVDGFGVYLRALLIAFVILFVIFTRISRFPHRLDTAEFFVLVFGATLGMCLMVSANHMLIVFLGLEMASVPSYILAGMMKENRLAGEAALKYAVYGAAAAGVMIYGISLLCGTLGTAQLPAMAESLAELLQTPTASSSYMVLVLGGLMLSVGVAFKLSAVPFHFWAPDVFEGAPAEIAAFLSIASKAAALGLLVRLAIGLGYTPDDPEALAALAPVRTFIVAVIAVLAAVTCTFGNLAAYGQTSMKRLLSYSTIAHAGYMMMPVAAMVAMMGDDPDAAKAAAAAMAFYITIYLFMNLGAFAFVAFVRRSTGGDKIEDYAGMIGTSTIAAICMSLILFSLVGLPPLAGFSAKFTAFLSVFQAGLFTLLVIGLLNTVISLFYYLRVVRVMVMPAGAGDEESIPKAHLRLVSPGGLFLLAVTVPVLVFGVLWNGLYCWAANAADSLFRLL